MESVLANFRSLELTNSTEPLSARFYAQFLVCAIVNGDLNEARFIHQRTPAEFQSDAVVSACWASVPLLWNLDFTGFFAHASSGLACHASVLGDFYPALLNAVRLRALQFLSSCYIEFSAVGACAMVGLDAHSFQALCLQHGWVIVDDWVRLRPIQSLHTPSAADHANILENMVKYSVFLEKAK
jgi:hypothetical protein